MSPGIYRQTVDNLKMLMYRALENNQYMLAGRYAARLHQLAKRYNRSCIMFLG